MNSSLKDEVIYLILRCEQETYHTVVIIMSQHISTSKTCCTPQTYITLYVNYISSFKNQLIDCLIFKKRGPLADVVNGDDTECGLGWMD